MKIKYIGILIGYSLNQPNPVVMNNKDDVYLISEGYMDNKGNLSKKANDLLSSVQVASEVFENIKEVKQDASDIVNGAKEVAEKMFTNFRNNTSSMLQKMADNMKVK